MMTTSKAHIQLFHRGAWRLVATVQPYPVRGQDGFNANSVLSYDIDYAAELYPDATPIEMVGCRYPVNFDSHPMSHWPTFLLDMVPTGNARKYWLKKLSLKDDHPSSWWPLLLTGAGSPPGNMRIREAVDHSFDHPTHAGFTTEEIVEKNENFIEYAQSRGATVAGATDVQGEAPKFLLVRDQRGKWHADAALPDDQAMDHWLVKFPRGKDDNDKIVLRNEAPYYDVAQQFGIRTSQKQLLYRDDALFIPRFDREVTRNGLARYGLESLASISNVCEFGKRMSHNRSCQMIMKYTTDPITELKEYILRDVLNVCLRNTDNHGRNTAFIKTPDGEFRLSPLFDFAPMFLDPEGIARASLWDSDGETEIGVPEWGQVATDLGSELKIDLIEMRSWLANLEERVTQLPDTMQKCGVNVEIIERLERRIHNVAELLSKARPTSGGLK
ncbi:MAG: HipA domain-containing protein [Thermodesulfobacteriota bacterium]|nr:HipA domain-containing protein [Thermodesulfobacteriota bacterium]